MLSQTLIMLAQAAAPAGADARLSLDWVTTAEATRALQDSLNPGNALVRIPEQRLVTELRPTLKLSYGDTLTGVARLSARLDTSRLSVTNPGATPTHAVSVSPSATWNELYAVARFSDEVSVSYGIQNFQWGEAELLSPSNPVVSDTGLARSALSEFRGADMARVNLSFGKSLSIVGILDVGDHEATSQDPITLPAPSPGLDAATAAGLVTTEPFGRPHHKRGLVKAEASLEDGGGALGVVGSAGDAVRPSFGEYGNLLIGDAVNVYFDAFHEHGSEVIYPLPENGPPVLIPVARTRRGAARLLTKALGGVRYTMASGLEARVEAYFNGEGYTPSEFDRMRRLARAAAAQGDPLALLFFAPGTELPGQRYAYASLKLPELDPWKMLNVYLRYLHSLGDNSGEAFGVVEALVGDRDALYLTALVPRGRTGSELNQTVAFGAGLGYKRSW